MGEYFILVLAVFCRLLTIIGTSTTDINSLEVAHVTQESLESPTTGPVTTSTSKLTTLNPKEAARLATLELSKQIFRDVAKKLRDSIASKNFSAFTTTPSTDGSDELHPFRHQPKHHHEHHWGPYFDEPLSGSGTLQVRTHLASEAMLNCRVGMLRDKTVMWLKRGDDKVHLLTVGDTTYSGDTRIAVKYQYPNNWRLSISPVQKEDAGLYVCQVSTHPPRVLLTNVTVLAPILRIVDEQGHEVKDRYYKAGSSIELSCKVSRTYSNNFNSITTTQPPKFTIRPAATLATTLRITTTIQNTNTSNELTTHEVLRSNETSSSAKVENFTKVGIPANETISSNEELKEDRAQENNNVFGITWYKDGKVLTDKVIARNMSSTFKQEHAQQKDGGSYSCSILNTSTVTVQVHVLSGETHAAVQHDTLSGCLRWTYSILILLTSLLSNVFVPSVMNFN